MSIGSIENKPITTGPRYFQGNIEDEHEFLETGTECNAKIEEEEKVVLQSYGRRKKMSKVRRDKLKRIPLRQFVASVEDAES